jgi:hypothetical protein
MTSLGFINAYSTAQTPLAANTNELVPISVVDNAGDFSIQNGNQLVCNNAGNWQITIQYQLYCLEDTEKAKNGTINGWLLYGANGATPTAVAASSASSSVTEKKGTNVLVIMRNFVLAAGDLISIGIRSDNQCKRCPNTVCKGFTSGSNVYSPSVIISAIKFGDIPV